VNRGLRFAQSGIALLCLTLSFAPAGSQQARPAPSAPANLAIDLPDVVAEVKAAFDAYEKAVVSNNTAVLDASFHNDPRTIRYGNAENLYGYPEIAAFRARSTGAGPRTLSKTAITTFGRDFAVVSTLTHRAAAPGKVGRQMQTWVRFPQGWQVVAAHVSTIDEPPAEKR
jgi:hypothetical protein